MLFFNISNTNFKKENKELKEENEKLSKKIIEARQEIAWFKTTNPISSVNRKLEDIEDILERDI